MQFPLLTIPNHFSYVSVLFLRNRKKMHTICSAYYAETSIHSIGGIFIGIAEAGLE